VNVTDENTRLYTVSRASSTVGANLPANTPILAFDPTFNTPSAAGNTILRERQVQFGARFEF
jgi:hypothetical protein